MIKLKKNPGLRQCAKLCLNSMYGKLAQRNDRIQNVVLTSHSDLLSILSRISIDIENVTLTPLTEEKLLASFNIKNEYLQELKTVNVVVASFISCYARLELYSQLKKLGERILYFDTDSIIYIEEPGKYSIPDGEYLGEFTDELGKYGEGAYISEGVFLGPKNYAFEVSLPDSDRKFYETKVRGFTLNYKNKAKINFNSMKEILFQGVNNLTITDDLIRSTRTGEVYSKTSDKSYQMVYDKRRRNLNNPILTIPFGY